MRVILQRVSRASVRVENKIVGAIEETGYLALVGITHEDGEAQLAKMADKTANLRLLMAKDPRLRLMRPFSPLVNSRSTEMRKRQAPVMVESGSGRCQRADF